jgi:hypothetical protein
MKRLISAKSAANVLLVAMGALAVFHVLVLAKVLPPDIVWGGRMGDAPESNLVVLETTALLVTLLFALIIAAKAGHVRAVKLRKVVHIGAWIVFAYFTLNIIGNLASSASVEKLVFTPISIVLAALALRLAIEK